MGEGSRRGAESACERILGRGGGLVECSCEGCEVMSAP